MTKYLATLVFVLVPLLWGAFMAVVFDSFENKLFRKSENWKHKDD